MSISCCCFYGYEIAMLRGGDDMVHPPRAFDNYCYGSPNVLLQNPRVLEECLRRVGADADTLCRAFASCSPAEGFRFWGIAANSILLIGSLKGVLMGYQNLTVSMCVLC